jgi:hypothetical protein
MTTLMDRMFELGRVLSTANGEQPPPVMLEPNGMRTIHETQTSVDVMAVMLATQYINRLLESVNQGPKAFNVQIHRLTFQGSINEATKDTILGYCLDAGWNDEHTRVETTSFDFTVVLFGGPEVQFIEMDEASFLIALEYNSGHSNNALCSSLKVSSSEYY